MFGMRKNIFFLQGMDPDALEDDEENEAEEVEDQEESDLQ